MANPTRIGINGFGRIGRLTLRAIYERYPGKLEVAAIHDQRVGDQNTPEVMRYLLAHDTVYGAYEKRMEEHPDGLIVYPTKTMSGKVAKIWLDDEMPWESEGVDIVIDCSGAYTDGRMAEETHRFQGGAKKVVISAPAKNEDLTIVMGVNEGQYDPSKHHIISAASCTTNCVTQVLKVLDDGFGIMDSWMVSLNAYTGAQKLVDQPHKDLRRSRAAAQNIIPTESSTGDSVGKVLPNLKERFHGVAFRIPILCGSVLTLTVKLETSARLEDVNALFATPRPYMGFTMEPLVSSDIIGDSRSAIIDGLSTCKEGDMIRVTAWYDNEWSFACRLSDLAAYIGKGL